MEFIERIKEQVLLADGAMGTLIQIAHLDIERDFANRENCSEILVHTRPDFILDVHRQYLAAGADCIETNTFGANKVVLAEFDLVEEAYHLNLKAAQLARLACHDFQSVQQPRYVVGSMGPGTKLPSLDQVSYDTLLDSYTVQALGLLDGGVDVFLLETHQDLLTLKAGIEACRVAMRSRQKQIPIFTQVTVETTGTLLVGSDLQAALVTLSAMKVDGIGLNCATGPQEMAEQVSYLGNNWQGFISVMPNAGLPMLIDGKTQYLLEPYELAQWHERFILEDGVAWIGGCCGTTPAHIAECRKMIDNLSDKKPRARNTTNIPQIASLYTSVELRQENALFAIGERANANGSKLFRDLIEREDWDATVAVGRAQIKEGSHALDVCTAFVGRPEIQDMQAVLTRYRTQINAPLIIDSTEIPVIEAALKLLPGKSVINSINFEDGEEKARKILQLARQFGAAVVALTIDEEGMAKSVEKKLEIAQRLYDFACFQYGLDPEDLFFDPLTFTICTGNADDREHGINTLNAIELISKKFPRCQILLGLSNISFGLKPEARHVLNSVFLHYALKNGLTSAIIHVSKIVPLYKIDPTWREAAENLIFNKWIDGQDPLLHFVNLFNEVKTQAYVHAENRTIEEILKDRIVEGDKNGLETDLQVALSQYSPLDIINNILLAGMKVVGDLFGSGEMQLPFVLQSAETMKTAVSFLTPFMERVEGDSKGVLVLATVKGDVHDIGKNLVDIILTNNGYKVINLGIKQPLSNILEAANEHQADAIGMSGLLVKSTVIMQDNLQEMHARGLTMPVLLGGAALTKKFVEQDCAQSYSNGVVYYAKDAFAGLELMDTIMKSKIACEQIS